MSAATIKKRLAAKLFPRYVRGLDQLNANARVRAWIAQTRPNVALCSDKWALYGHLNAREIGIAPIDYLEFGVYRGSSIRSWSELNRHLDSQFVGFDSFRGLPEAWSDEFPAGHFDAHGDLPEIRDPRVSFVRGWFQESLPGFLRTFTPRSRLVVHVDCDLYSSTLYCLTKLDPLFVPGSILIFDEFSTPLHEFRAFNDYAAAYKRELHPLAITSDYAMQAAFIFE